MSHAASDGSVLDRFCRLYSAMMEGRSWWNGFELYRYASLVLCLEDRPVAETTAAFDAICEEIKARMPWYRRSAIDSLLGALLIRTRWPAAEFFAEVERAEPLFKSHFRWVDRVHESMAIYALLEGKRDRRVDAASVERIAAIHAQMKTAHPWLTNRGDWPACAFLATTHQSPSEISARLEALYQGLLREKFRSGDLLQRATQILYFHPGSVDSVVARCRDLYRTFEERGLWMNSSDYDDLALLTFTRQPVPEVCDTLARHRDVMAALPQKPAKNTSFILASGTTLLELTADDPSRPALAVQQSILLLQFLIPAAQAAPPAAPS